MLTKDQFRQRIEDYISKTQGMSATKFGVAATGDPTFVFELRKGRNVGLDLVQRVITFIDETARAA